MPLIVISGTPASGKSFRANQIKQYFEERQKIVHVINEDECIENAGYSKNEYFADSQKEKIVRADIKSQAIRKLNKSDVVIIDSGNYIKSFRYEIYCVSKAAGISQCTVYCATPETISWDFNENRENSKPKYSKEIFDALWLRFEEPNSKNRWDSPLFFVTPEENLVMEDLYNSLYEKKPPAPNQSTQNAPLSSTNFLFELDKITNEIVQEITGARKIGALGPISVNKSTEKVDISPDITPSQLNRYKRQYINYTKSHLNSNTLDNVPTLFVQYLNSVCKE